VVALVAKANASDYWNEVKRGADAAGKDLNVKVEWNGPQTEQEGAEQLRMLDHAIAKKPIGIGFAPQDDAQSGAPAKLDTAKADNIPVVIFDTPLKDSNVPIATIASDNHQIGEMAAEHLSELIGGKGKVGIIAHGTTGTAKDRTDGFKDWMKQNAPGITVLDEQIGNSDQAESRQKANAVIGANADLAGMFGTDDDSAIAIADAVGSKDIKVIGVDASPDEVSLVKSGAITGAVTQNPYNIGYQTVQILVNAADGKDPAQKQIVSPAVWYTKDNLDTKEVQEVLGS
jgi:ribose transport system substrate-binding protein